MDLTNTKPDKSENTREAPETDYEPGESSQPHVASPIFQSNEENSSVHATSDIVSMQTLSSSTPQDGSTVYNNPEEIDESNEYGIRKISDLFQHGWILNRKKSFQVMPMEAGQNEKGQSRKIKKRAEQSKKNPPKEEHYDVEPAAYSRSKGKPIKVNRPNQEQQTPTPKPSREEEHYDVEPAAYSRSKSKPIQLNHPNQEQQTPTPGNSAQHSAIIKPPGYKTPILVVVEPDKPGIPDSVARRKTKMNMLTKLLSFGKSNQVADNPNKKKVVKVGPQPAPKVKEPKIKITDGGVPVAQHKTKSTKTRTKVDDKLEEIRQQELKKGMRIKHPHHTIVDIEDSASSIPASRKHARPGHTNKYRARRNWKKLYAGVRKQIKQKKPTAQSASTEDSGKGVLGKVMGFFKADDSATDRHSSDEEYAKQLNKYGRNRGKKYSTISVDRDRTKKENYKPAKNVALHRIGQSLQKADSSKTDDPSKFDVNTDYKTWQKDAHSQLPSRAVVPLDSPTVELFSQLVPMLRRKSGGEDAMDALEEFRERRREEKQKRGEKPERKADRPERHVEKVERKPSLFSLSSLDSRHSATNIDVRAIPGNLAQRKEVKQAILQRRGAKRFPCWLRIKGVVGSWSLHISRTYRDFTNNITIWHDTIHQIDGQYGVIAATYFRWLRTIMTINIMYFFLCLFVIGIPHWVLESDNSTDTSFRSTDMVMAEGVFAASSFFYGAYPRRAAWCFLAVLCVVFLINSIFIIKRLSTFYKYTRSRDTKISRGEKLRLILCAWDFSISDLEAAKAQHRSIERDFRLVLRQRAARNLEAEIGCINRLLGKCLGRFASPVLHWIVNFFVVIISISFAYATWILLEWRKGEDRSDDETRRRSWGDTETALSISLATEIFTTLCYLVTKAESWDTIAHRTHSLLIRIGFWYFSIIASIYIFWLQEANWIVTKHPERCWETEFGNELFRIVVLEFIFSTLISIATDYLWPRIHKIFKPDRLKPEFRVESNMMNLVFLHTLSGIGIFFSPFLSIIVIGRLWVTYYWKKKTIFETCSYPAHQFHASEVFTPYLFSFFLSYLVVTNANGWLISDGVPSHACGPFGGLDKIGLFLTHYVGEDVIFLQPGFVYTFFLFVLCVIYTIRAWGKAYSSTGDALNELLILERLDRDFLLKAIFNIAQAHAKRKATATTTNTKNSQQKVNLEVVDIDAQIEEAAKDALLQPSGGRRADPDIRQRAKFIQQFLSPEAVVEVKEELQAHHPPETFESSPAPPNSEKKKKRNSNAFFENVGSNEDVLLIKRGRRAFANRRMSKPAEIYLDTLDKQGDKQVKQNKTQKK